MYFVGVTTAQSSIRRVFDGWMRILDRRDVTLTGIDLPPHADPLAYRRVTEFLKNDPLSLGALVTTHKVDLLRASSDLFDELDDGARALHEISCISKRNGALRGSAKDPLTSSLALRSFLPQGYWENKDAEIVCLGAGGSALALASSFTAALTAGDRPRRIVITNRSPRRLEEFRESYEKLASMPPCELVHAAEASVNDSVVSSAPAGSVIVNATGLGKDAPGSPLTWDVRFPDGAYVWDFNYRGELVFLDQARAQQEAKGLHIEDGWVYFLHGWTQVIAEVLDVDIQPDGRVFSELARAAEAVRTG
jgi:shikimate 5-dehydrogenase